MPQVGPITMWVNSTAQAGEWACGASLENRVGRLLRSGHVAEECFGHSPRRQMRAGFGTPARQIAPRASPLSLCDLLRKASN